MLLRLVLQIIGNGSKERTRTFQAALYIALTKIANEGNDIKSTALTRQLKLSGQQGLDETFTHLPVGIGQPVHLELGIISLDRQVTTLI